MVIPARMEETLLSCESERDHRGVRSVPDVRSVRASSDVNKQSCIKALIATSNKPAKSACKGFVRPPTGTGSMYGVCYPGVLHFRGIYSLREELVDKSLDSMSADSVIPLHMVVQRYVPKCCAWHYFGTTDDCRL
jgi:hypothetical protein